MKYEIIGFLMPPLLFLALISSTNAPAELARGSLGVCLVYIIESPTELKVGVDAPIHFVFQNIGDSSIFIQGIWIWICGAGINSTETGISKLVVKDVELHSLETINETIKVKPFREGVVNLSIHAEYNFTDFYGNSRYDWGEDVIFIHAHTLTLNDLKNITNQLSIVISILSAIIIVLIVIIVYLSRKQMKHHIKESR